MTKKELLKNVTEVGKRERSTEVNINKVHAAFTDEKNSVEMKDVKTFLNRVLVNAHAAVSEKEAADNMSFENMRLALFTAFMNQVANAKDEKDNMMVIALYEFIRFIESEDDIRMLYNYNHHKRIHSKVLAEAAMNSIHQAEAFEMIQRAFENETSYEKIMDQTET